MPIPSHYLDVPLDRIRVVQGDTDRVKTGNGTGDSRSIPVGVAMVSRATLGSKLKDLAADELEAASPILKSPMAGCGLLAPTG